MNDHIMNEDQAESRRQWLKLWKWLWLTSLCTVGYAFITPTFGADWMWLLGVFLVSFMLGTICKGFADDVAMNRSDTAFALTFIALINAKYILVAVMAIIIVAITGV